MSLWFHNSKCFWIESTELLKTYIRTRRTDSREQIYQRLEQEESKWDKHELVKDIGTIPWKIRWNIRVKHTSMYPKVVLKRLHENNLAWHCSNRNYRKATAENHSRQFVLCSREGRVSRLIWETPSQSSSQNYPKWPQTWESVVRQGWRQGQGWRKVEERDHTAARAEAGSRFPGATSLARSHAFTPPDTLHRDP